MLIFAKTISAAAGIGLLVLVVSAGGCDQAPEARIQAAPVVQPTYFTLGIEQDGKRIAVRGHQVTLRRRPFRLVFHFDRMDPMLVHASATPEMLEAARAGQDVNTMFPPESSIVEEFLNPEGVLFVGRSGYHNWGYYGRGKHKFDPDGVDKLEETGEKGFLCHRTIAAIRGEGAEVSLAKWPHETMYLVFVQAQPRTAAEVDTTALQEKQRDWLELRFIDDQVTSK